VPIKEASCIHNKLFIKIIFYYLRPKSLTLMGGVGNLKDVNHPSSCFNTLDFFNLKSEISLKLYRRPSLNAYSRFPRKSF
jgi:hypothetical protein